MKKLALGAGCVGITGFFALIGAIIGTTIYGLISAFKVAWWMGVLFLFFAPASFVEGLIKIFGGPDLAQKVFDLLMK